MNDIEKLGKVAFTIFAVNDEIKRIGFEEFLFCRFKPPVDLFFAFSAAIFHPFKYGFKIDAHKNGDQMTGNKRLACGGSANIPYAIHVDIHDDAFAERKHTDDLCSRRTI